MRSPHVDDTPPVARSSIDVEVSADRVWRALTTDRGLESWMGLTPVGNGTRVTVTETAPRPPGGLHRATNASISAGCGGPAAHGVLGSFSVVGAWSLRLAMLALACRMVRL